MKTHVITNGFIMFATVLILVNVLTALPFSAGLDAAEPDESVHSLETFFFHSLDSFFCIGFRRIVLER